MSKFIPGTLAPVPPIIPTPPKLVWAVIRRGFRFIGRNGWLLRPRWLAHCLSRLFYGGDWTPCPWCGEMFSFIEQPVHAFGSFLELGEAVDIIVCPRCVEPARESKEAGRAAAVHPARAAFMRALGNPRIRLRVTAGIE